MYTLPQFIKQKAKRTSAQTSVTHDENRISCVQQRSPSLRAGRASITAQAQIASEQYRPAMVLFRSSVKVRPNKNKRGT